MRKKITIILSLALILVMMLTVVAGCDDDEDSPEATASPTATESTEPTAEATPALKGTMTIFHAGSLAVPFSEMEAEFESMYPDVDVQCESASSGVTIRKVTELEKNAEIIASADYSLIPDLMYPDYADWYMTFAKNRMVLCYTEQSLHADEVNSENWYEILLRDNVEYGHSDLLDPCGYRTLLVWQLAEEYYTEPGLYDNLVANCPEKNIRPKSVQLVALLESGDLDYASEYSSVAMQHNLKYVEFPTEIDLSSVEHKDFYAQSNVDIPGKEPGETINKIGKPIVYGVTIPKNTENPELAIAFMEYLLGDKGQAIMNKNGQPSIVPAVADDLSKLPVELQSYAVETSSAPEAAESGRLKVATTSSLDNTGLWETLEPMFEKQNDVDLDIVAVGTGIALEYGRNGDVDVITVHSKAREIEYVEQGHGVERVPFAYNYFLIVGPEDDPAGIKGMSPEDAFNTLFESEAGTFVSRGDDSGTHGKEKTIWANAGYEYEEVQSAGSWYLEAGSGMGATLVMADEKQGYTLSDTGTYLAYKGDLDLVPIVDEGDTLLNVYSVIVGTNTEMPNTSQKLVDFLTSDEIQQIMGDFGFDEYGMALFTPCAGPIAPCDN